MTNAEFKNIFDNGYKVNYTKGTSELRCPKCGNESYLSSSYSTTVTCKNKHNFTLIDFTVSWTQIRNDLLSNMLTNSCDTKCNSTN